MSHCRPRRLNGAPWLELAAMILRRAPRLDGALCTVPRSRRPTGVTAARPRPSLPIAKTTDTKGCSSLSMTSPISK